MIAACIPAYNEERAIARVVLDAQKYADKVIVCDDGSDDMTGEIAHSLGATVIRHERNLGKGAALRSLFNASLAMGAKVIVTLDGDGQHDATEIPEVTKPILEGTADISVGSRFSGKNHIPVYRTVGNRLISLLANTGAKDKFVDTTSGFRAYSRFAVETIDPRQDGMGIDSQLLLDARAKKLRIVDTPISVTYGKDTSTYHPVRHFAQITGGMLQYASEEHPLLLVGLPGVVVFGMGIYFGALLLSVYDRTGTFAIGYAFLAVGSVIVGTFTTLVSIVLYAVKSISRRLNGANHKTTV